MSFDADSQSRANIPAGKWQFFQFTVPPNTLGWDLRFSQVTSGSPGSLSGAISCQRFAKSDQRGAPGTLVITSLSQAAINGRQISIGRTEI